MKKSLLTNEFTESKFRLPAPNYRIKWEFHLVATSVRSIHAGNVDVPDFSYYRRSAVQSPSAKSGDSAADRMSYRFLVKSL